MAFYWGTREKIETKRVYCKTERPDFPRSDDTYLKIEHDEGHPLYELPITLEKNREIDWKDLQHSLATILISHDYCREDFKSGRISLSDNILSKFDVSLLPKNPFGSCFFRVQNSGNYVGNMDIVFEYTGHKGDELIFLPTMNKSMRSAISDLEESLEKVNLLREDVAEAPKNILKHLLGAHKALRSKVFGLFEESD